MRDLIHTSEHGILRVSSSFVCGVGELLLRSIRNSAASKDQIRQSGVTVAALFFKNVFGEQAQRALTVFVALRSVTRACYVVVFIKRIFPFNSAFG